MAGSYGKDQHSASIKGRNLFAILGTIKLSRRTVLHGVCLFVCLCVGLVALLVVSHSVSQ